MKGDGEIVLADIAAGQWGLVTTPQAVAAGLSRVQLSRLSKAGVLIRLSHGVYALRGSLGTENLELLAAWLTLDPTRLASDRLDNGPRGPVVSHASAAALYNLGDLDADRHEFTAPTRKQTRRADLRLHRGTLPEEDVTLHRGLPITTPTRTIVDLLADGHDGGHVAGVLADAVRTRQIDPGALATRIGPYAARFGLPRGDGSALLRHLLEIGGVAEQADADVIADVARAAHVPVPAMMAALQEAQLAPIREALDRLSPLAALRTNQLAPIQEALDRLSPLAALSEAQLAPVRKALESQVSPINEVAKRALLNPGAARGAADRSNSEDE